MSLCIYVCATMNVFELHAARRNSDETRTRIYQQVSAAKIFIVIICIKQQITTHFVKKKSSVLVYLLLLMIWHFFSGVHGQQQLVFLHSKKSETTMFPLNPLSQVNEPIRLNHLSTAFSTEFMFLVSPLTSWIVWVYSVL